MSNRKLCAGVDDLDGLEDSDLTINDLPTELRHHQRPPSPHADPAGHHDVDADTSDPTITKGGPLPQVGRGVMAIVTGASNLNCDRPSLEHGMEPEEDGTLTQVVGSPPPLAPRHPRELPPLTGTSRPNRRRSGVAVTQHEPLRLATSSTSSSFRHRPALRPSPSSKSVHLSSSLGGPVSLLSSPGASCSRRSSSLPSPAAADAVAAVVKVVDPSTHLGPDAASLAGSLMEEEDDTRSLVVGSSPQRATYRPTAAAGILAGLDSEETLQVNVQSLVRPVSDASPRPSWSLQVHGLLGTPGASRAATLTLDPAHDSFEGIGAAVREVTATGEGPESESGLVSATIATLPLTRRTYYRPRAETLNSLSLALLKSSANESTGATRRASLGNGANNICREAGAEVTDGVDQARHAAEIILPQAPDHPGHPFSRRIQLEARAMGPSLRGPGLRRHGSEGCLAECSSTTTSRRWGNRHGDVKGTPANNQGDEVPTMPRGREVQPSAKWEHHGESIVSCHHC